MSTHCSRALKIPELLDYIVNFLGDDLPALKASSLVCSTWCKAAARQLFSTLHIDPHDPLGLHIWIADDDDGKKLVGEAAFELSYIWLVTRPRIVDNVKTISISNWFVNQQQTSPSQQPTGDHGQCPALIVDIMATFHQLRNLVIFRHEGWRTPITLSSYMLSTPLSRLKLEVLDVRCDIIDNVDRPGEYLLLRDLLVHVEEVKSLTLWDTVINLWPPWRVEWGSVSPVSRTRLGSFTLPNTRMWNFPSISHVLVSLFDMSGFTRIALEKYWPYRSVDTFNTFIQGFTSQIEGFGFSIDESTTWREGPIWTPGAYFLMDARL